MRFRGISLDPSQHSTLHLPPLSKESHVLFAYININIPYEPKRQETVSTVTPGTPAVRNRVTPGLPLPSEAVTPSIPAVRAGMAPLKGKK